MANHSLALDDVFHALADKTRRGILRRLGSGPATVTDLADPFAMALPSFLRHLGVLEGCGLIATHKVGRVRTCRINPARLATAERWMAQQRALWESRTDRLTQVAEALEAKEHSR